MDLLLTLYHSIVGLPHWAWVALGIAAAVSAVWLVVDFITFLIASFVAIVLGVLVFMFGWQYLQHVL